MDQLETDYLVVGAGAAGMAFTDTLVRHSDAEVVLVDRRAAPGGHWNDGYPFLRLHLPSAYYGVDSLPLGADQMIADGPEAGLYERASGNEVCAYYARVLQEQLLPTSRVRFLGMTDHVPDPREDRQLLTLPTGEVQEVLVRRAVVDASYLQTAVPKTHTPSFTVHPSVHLAPVHELVRRRGDHDRFVVLGAGKTALDACLWLLEDGVRPEDIRWVRPRDPWLLDRASWQPLDQVGSIMDGLSRDVEAAAAATSMQDLFERLERSGRLLRLDEQTTPTMYHCATTTHAELAQLRRVTDVVRMGHVLALLPDAVVLEHGSVPSAPDTLYVDASAYGLRFPPVVPVFAPGRITVQQLRGCSPSLNAALTAYVEATRPDLAEKNRLCPPSAYPDAAEDWLRTLLKNLTVGALWRAEPDLAAWLEGSRLNLSRGLTQRRADVPVQRSLASFATHANPAAHRLTELLQQHALTSA